MKNKAFDESCRSTFRNVSEPRPSEVIFVPNATIQELMGSIFEHLWSLGHYEFI